MKLYRLSNYGFQSFYQEWLKNLHQQVHDVDLSNLNEFQIHLIQKTQSLLPKDWIENFNYWGTFAFTKKPTDDMISFYLNHMKNSDERIMVEQEFNPNTSVFIDDGFFGNNNQPKLLHEIISKSESVYIPSFQRYD